jgi:hypothetical protein
MINKLKNLITIVLVGSLTMVFFCLVKFCKK